MATLSPISLAPLAKRLSEFHDGELLSLQQQLNTIVYMLHYLEKEAFTAQEIRNATYALHNLSEGIKASALQHTD